VTPLPCQQTLLPSDNRQAIRSLKSCRIWGFGEKSAAEQKNFAQRVPNPFHLCESGIMALPIVKMAVCCFIVETKNSILKRALHTLINQRDSMGTS
jgi:hypothetical protein